MDGGFSEAALMGALVGGGSSLLSGKNPLSGALLGGLTGGVTGGIGNLANGADFFASPGLTNGSGLGSFFGGSSDAASSLPPLTNDAAAQADLGSFAKTPYGVDINSATNSLGPSLPPSPSANLTPTADGNFIDTSAFKPTTDAATQTTAGATANATAKPGMLQGLWNDYKNASLPVQAGIGIAGAYGINQLMKPRTMVDPNIGTSSYSGPKLHDLSPNFQPLDVPAPTPYYTASYAQGGIAALAGGGMDSPGISPLGMGDNQEYPGSKLDTTQFAVPSQMPTSSAVVGADYEQKTNPYTGEPIPGMAQGGVTGLGGYADGGNPRLLKGPGDGMSDNIPATIDGKQPARLADSEFVVPADVVSHLGNGSTDAGAKHLYDMMDRVRKARTGRTKQSPAINAKKFLPA